MLKFTIRPNTKGRSIWNFGKKMAAEELVHNCPWCRGTIYYEIDSVYVTCPFCKRGVSIGTLVKELKRRIEYHKGAYESEI